MICFDRVKVGDILYDCHKQRMGNTTMRAMATFKVAVLEKHEDHCMVSWNYNRPERYDRRRIESLRRTPVKKTGRWA
jgi:hypothetical protein